MSAPALSAFRELSDAGDFVQLEWIVLEYFRFICDELRTNFDLDVSPEEPTANMMAQPEKFLPPLGRSFVSEADGNITGMVFLKPTGDPCTVEIKRLYVRPNARGTGLGRRLAEFVIDVAREGGASRVVLDSTKNLTQAIKMYERMGFEATDPYPSSELVSYAEILPYAVFMAKDISST